MKAGSDPAAWAIPGRVGVSPPHFHNPLGATTMPLFHVELTGSPACTIEADDTNQAWDLYRVKMGIVKSKHQPRISEATVHASVVAQPQSGTTVAKVELPAPEPAPVLDAPKPDESPVPDAPSGDADDAPEAPEKDAPKPETKSKSKR